MQPSIIEIYQAYENKLSADGKRVEPATPAHIKELEELTGRSLSQEHRDFLEIMGTSPGVLIMQGQHGLLDSSIEPILKDYRPRRNNPKAPAGAPWDLIPFALFAGRCEDCGPAMLDPKADPQPLVQYDHDEPTFMLGESLSCFLMESALDQFEMPGWTFTDTVSLPEKLIARFPELWTEIEAMLARNRFQRHWLSQFEGVRHYTRGDAVVIVRRLSTKTGSVVVKSKAEPTLQLVLSSVSEFCRSA